MKTKELRESLSKSGLTLRQSEVVELVLKGCSNKEIANMLFLTEKAIKYHLSNAMDKLELEIRTRDFLKHVYDHYVHPELYEGQVIWTTEFQDTEIKLWKDLIKK